MNSTTSKPQRHIPAWIIWTFMLVLLAGVSVVVIQQLPRAGISTDLSGIGQGKPVLVLTRDIHYLGGAEVLEYLKQLNPEYQTRLEMRIAHQGQPDGQAFANRYSTYDGDLVLLNGAGEEIGRLQQPGNLQAVRQLLSQAE